MKPALRIGIVVAALCVIAMLVAGRELPHTGADRRDPTPADCGVSGHWNSRLREGLESVFWLGSQITASMTGAKRAHRGQSRSAAELRLSGAVDHVVHGKQASSAHSATICRHSICKPLPACGCRRVANYHELVLSRSIGAAGFALTIAAARRCSKMRATPRSPSRACGSDWSCLIHIAVSRRIRSRAFFCKVIICAWAAPWC